MKCPHNNKSTKTCPDCNYDKGWEGCGRVVLKKLREIDSRADYLLSEIKKIVEG